MQSCASVLRRLRGGGPILQRRCENAAHSYGFAAFTVDPGSHPGDFTTIEVTYYDVVGINGQLAPFETFTLRRPRRDRL